MSAAASTVLPALECPLCGQPMTNDTPPNGIRPQAAESYEDCLRRCAPCMVGFSNARANPTLIHDDPLGNVPMEVRQGALETLQQALNVRNRDNKVKKFGYSTSEDAVTWTVFSFLSGHRPDLLPRLGRSLFGLQPSDEASVLLWGVPITPGTRGGAVQQALLGVTAALGEDSRSCSEPDVILDYGDAGVVVIEVKYRSGNDQRTEANWERYVTNAGAFCDPVEAQASGLYELVRNWRIAHDLAGGRPFAVVSLAFADTLAATQGMGQFKASLRTSPDRRFVPMTWDSFLTALESEAGGLPSWLEEYLGKRDLR